MLPTIIQDVQNFGVEPWHDRAIRVDTNIHLFEE